MPLSPSITSQEKLRTITSTQYGTSHHQQDQSAQLRPRHGQHIGDRIAEQRRTPWRCSPSAGRADHLVVERRGQELPVDADRDPSPVRLRQIISASGIKKKTVIQSEARKQQEARTAMSGRDSARAARRQPGRNRWRAVVAMAPGADRRSVGRQEPAASARQDRRDRPARLAVQRGGAR